MVAAQARMETLLLLRNGEQLVLALVIPLLVLVAGVRLGDELLALGRPAVDLLTPGVIALAVLSTAFTSLAIATGFERRYGVLKRLGASPLPRGGLLAAKVLSLAVVEAAQLVVIAAVATTLGWRPQLGVQVVAVVLLLVVLGTAAFAALGLLLAGTLRAEATLAVANLVYVLLLLGGAVVAPPSAYGAAADLLVLLPSGALATGLRSALLSGEVLAAPLLVLAAWAVGAGVATARTFRWE
ncbi:MAG: ABC transporter permease [Actinomycetota bacterium]|nr:ABC transporter permease [Actinomycetota bacterium]